MILIDFSVPHATSRRKIHDAGTAGARDQHVHRACRPNASISLVADCFSGGLPHWVSVRSQREKTEPNKPIVHKIDADSVDVTEVIALRKKE